MPKYDVQNHNDGEEKAVTQTATSPTAALIFVVRDSMGGAIRGKLRIEALGGRDYAAYDDQGLLGEFSVEAQ